MTTPSLTVEDAIGQLRPHVTEDFLRTWRKVGMIVGYRNLGRALSAIAPRKGAVKGIVGAQAAGYVLTGKGKCAISPKQRGRDVWKCRKGEKRNPAGGLTCANPGGYEREWGKLVGALGARGSNWKPGDSDSGSHPAGIWTSRLLKHAELETMPEVEGLAAS